MRLENHDEMELVGVNSQGEYEYDYDLESNYINK